MAPRWVLATAAAIGVVAIACVVAGAARSARGDVNGDRSTAARRSRAPSSGRDRKASRARACVRWATKVAPRCGRCAGDERWHADDDGRRERPGRREHPDDRAHGVDQPLDREVRRHARGARARRRGRVMASVAVAHGGGRSAESAQSMSATLRVPVAETGRGARGRARARPRAAGVAVERGRHRRASRSRDPHLEREDRRGAARARSSSIARAGSRTCSPSSRQQSRVRTEIEQMEAEELAMRSRAALSTISVQVDRALPRGARGQRSAPARHAPAQRPRRRRPRGARERARRGARRPQRSADTPALDRGAVSPGATRVASSPPALHSPPPDCRVEDLVPGWGRLGGQDARNQRNRPRTRARQTEIR